MQKDWSNLAKIIYKRTYSRIKESGLSETWEDTVDRVISGNVKNYIGTEAIEPNEIERLKYFMLNRKAMPAGRGIWFSGTEAQQRLGGLGNNNCAAIALDDIFNLITVQDYLMLGAGVGVSVEHRYTSKIPKVKKDVKIEHVLSNDADFIVPDSREGWCKLTARVLKSYFITGKGFTYSTICVRGAGESIKGFGGKASGPLPLIDYVEKFSNIIKSRENKFLRPIDCLDLVCAIGEMVVSGNVRRSAIIILGDPWDKEYLKAKRWDLGNIPTQRAMANLSVICDDIDDVHPLFWKTYESGEPFGILNRKNMQKFGRMGTESKDSATLTNPCQPASATILGKQGITTMGDLKVGDEIWSETGWTKVIKKWGTGVKPVFRYNTNAGIFVGTENHRLVSNGEKVEAKDCDSVDVLTYKGCAFDDWDHQIVMDGLVFGDGSVHQASKDKIYLSIGENDQDYFQDKVKDYIVGPHPVRYGEAFKVITTIQEGELPRTFDRHIPERYIIGGNVVVASFLRGLYSANGSICGNRVTLKASSFNVIRQVQIMLSSLGIRSYYTTNKSKLVHFENGEYRCKESYDLNISSDRLVFAGLIGFIQDYKTYNLREICEVETKPGKSTYDITTVEYLGDEEVFDITVDNEPHTYWTGGLNVSNCAEIALESGEICNLQEIFLPNLESVEEFKEAARLMHRWGKRVSNEPYHVELTDKVVKRNRRIGTGITGCLQSELFKPEILDEVYAEVEKENFAYSKLLGIPKSIRTTTVKPSGTLSLIGDCTPGIHPSYSRYYIRRVRLSADDALVQLLKDAGHNVEFVRNFDGSLNRRTVVADFYCKTPEGTPCADEDFDTWKQLDVVKMAQKHWSDNSVSVTVYYKRNELSEIKNWLRDNLSSIKTISFLCHDDHGFDQAPYEAITEEQYNKLSAKVKPIDFEAITQGELENMECSSGACPIR